MVNVPELRKVLEFISANPEKHDQQVWARVWNHNETEAIPFQYGNGYTEDFHVVTEQAVWTCDTSACLAGWTALQHGWRPAIGANGTVYQEGHGFNHVEDVAKNVLGLDSHQASMLFYVGHSIRSLWLLANDFTDGEIEIPEEYK